VRAAEHAARDALEALDRRGFLRLVALAAAAGALPAGCSHDPAGLTVPGDLKALSARGWAVLHAAAARVVGPPGAALVANGAVDPARRADAFLAGAPSLAPAASAALLVLEFGVHPLLPKWRAFTALDGPAQDRVLADLAGSRIAAKRRIFAGVKTLSLLGFYAAPEARAQLRYPLGAASPQATIADAMAWTDTPEAPRAPRSAAPQEAP
jgi:hypothetical protein